MDCDLAKFMGGKWGQDYWLLFLALLLTCWVTLDKSLHQSVPQFPHL